MGGRYSAHLSATRKTGPILKPSALISEFVENGFVTMPSSLEAGVHSGLYESTKHLFRSMRDGFNPHNNVLPMLPALWDVLDDLNCSQPFARLSAITTSSIHIGIHTSHRQRLIELHRE